MPGAVAMTSNFAFLHHVAAFALVAALTVEFVLVKGLLSIYPTRVFASWRKSIQQGLAPTVEPAKLRVLRTIIHWELIGVVLLLLCAALMARGVGYVGT